MVALTSPTDPDESRGSFVDTAGSSTAIDPEFTVVERHALTRAHARPLCGCAGDVIAREKIRRPPGIL
jgi:hypothetical protein